MKKVTFIIIGLTLIGSLYGQGYQWQAEIDKIDSSGFYKIDLDPKIIAKLNTNFSDLRIKDTEEKDVPYFIEKEPFSVTKRVFKEYDVVQKIKWINGATVLVVENKEKDTINNIHLQIKNFDVRKRIELAGSDDYLNWYTIKENYTFRSANGQYKTSEIKSLNFNYTDYRFYRIVIYDWYSLPINVMKIGYYDTYRELGKFKKLEEPTLTRFDSLETKQTYIKVNFNERPYFDKLVIKVAKPKYYYRRAKICFKHTDTKGNVYYVDEDYFTLNSNSDLTSYFSNFQYKEFYIVIENNDNPPLEDVKVETYQLNRYLIAHLESDKNYKLVFENENINERPIYDIDYFKNKIGGELPIIYSKNLSPLQKKEDIKSKSSTYWIWGVITLVALLLGYVSFKMISEMEKSK